jgi:predicted nucleic acid-binding protein
MLFVYWLENHPKFGAEVDFIRRRMFERGDSLCTSVFTLGELLVGPQKQHDRVLEEEIASYFSSQDLQVLLFDSATARRYAEIRATGTIKPADAIHLACASCAGVDLYLTNDSAIRKLKIPGIGFIDGLETTVFGPNHP